MSSVTPTQDGERINSLVSRLHQGERNMDTTVQEVIVDNMRTMLEDAPTLLTVVETLASEGTKWVRQDVTIRSVRPSASIKVTVVGSSST